MKTFNVKPFVKWAGGKSQLLNEIRMRYPRNIKRYCEPFVGGGAVLLDVLSNYSPKEVLINDINCRLVNTYIQIRDNSERVIKLLSEYQSEYWEKSADSRKEMYLKNRKEFNSNLDLNSPKMAALFIFLNKTCFNGLYRVNRKGEFNVPIGSYKMPSICDEENLRTISKLLDNVEIHCGDYSECRDFINNNTFVYIDPPYRPLTQTASFNSYSENRFGDEEQIALSGFIDKISSEGAKVIASNSDPKNSDINDSFFDRLYSAYKIDRIGAKRIINSNGNNRGTVSELLICNF